MGYQSAKDEYYKLATKRLPSVKHIFHNPLLYRTPVYAPRARIYALVRRYTDAGEERRKVADALDLPDRVQQRPPHGALAAKVRDVRGRAGDEPVRCGRFLSGWARENGI